MRTALALAIALAVSLFANAWQWQNRTGVKATAKGETVRLVDVAQGNDDALAIVSARMWELAGKSAQLEVAIKRGAEQHQRITAQLAAERAKRAKELDDAYQHEDVRDWADRPVPAAISRLYTARGVPDKNR